MLLTSASLILLLTRVREIWSAVAKRSATPLWLKAFAYINA
jgi:hypothetical protein